MDPVLYVVDESDQIIEVNDAWSRFAMANDAMHLRRDGVLHKPLFDFISDESTRLFYHELLKRTRAGYSSKFPFRCDSPSCLRLMEMEMIPGAVPGTVEFHSRTLSEQERPAIRLIDVKVERGEEVITMCSWCKSVESGGAWIELEDAVAQLRIFESPRLPMVSHGICTRCYARISSFTADEAV